MGHRGLLLLPFFGLLDCSEPAERAPARCADQPAKIGAPAEVVVADVNARALALDETDLYAVDTPNLVRIPKAGGDARRILRASIGRLSVDARHVYFTGTAVDGTRRTGIWRLDKVTLEVRQLVDEPEPGDLVADGSVTSAIASGAAATTSLSKVLYWVNKPAGMIRRLRLDDDAAQPEDFAPAPDFSANLVTDREKLYFATASPKALRSVTIATREAATVATLERFPNIPLVADRVNVYVPVSFELTFSPKDGGPTRIAASDATPFGAAADGKNLYWTDISQCSVRAFDVAAGSTRTIVGGQREPAALAIDDVHVYWAVAKDRLLLRTPKP